MCVMLYFLSSETMPGERVDQPVEWLRLFSLSFWFRVVNIASRAGMLESIRNSEIRQHLISPNATIETISDILSDFIK